MKKYVSLLIVLSIILTVTSLPASAASVEKCFTTPETVTATNSVRIPAGYTYEGRVKYDADWRIDAMAFGGGTLASITIALINPALGILGNFFLNLTASAVGSGLGAWAQSAMEGDHLYGYYYDYVYICDDPGIYPYIYFHHLKYYSSNNVLLYDEGRSEYALLPVAPRD
ncbi:MAG: hypothetical protein VB096_07635 [Pseudoflavonifractor sp.]|nr:hypothetical protein [Pseudoflavonifractor sp.]